MRTMTPAPEQAVTVLISRRVKPGHEVEFDRLSQQLMAVAATFAGHLGAQLVRPSDEPDSEDGLYHVVLAFASRVSLDAWQHSPARALGLTALAPHIEGVSTMRQVSGLAHWFQSGAAGSAAQPPRWKVGVVTWLGICPTVYLVFLLLGPLLQAWPLLPRVALITALVVAAMTWWVAPQLTRWCRPWLYAGVGPRPQ
jgi:antibiotic biosynthesis monooxygenase (ABM) superfamily enzyme